MVRKSDRQIGIGHQQAFTDRLSEIQWLDFAHGGSCAPSDGRARPRQQEYDPAGDTTPPPTLPASPESNSSILALSVMYITVRGTLTLSPVCFGKVKGEARPN